MREVDNKALLHASTCAACVCVCACARERAWGLRPGCVQHARVHANPSEAPTVCAHVQAQRQRELLAMGDAHTVLGEDLVAAATAGGSGSGSLSGSGADSGAEAGADGEGRAHAGSRKRRRRHRQARAAAAAAAAGPGSEEDVEGGEQGGRGGGSCKGGLQGDDGTGGLMECEGAGAQARANGGLGLESLRRPGARERAREARRRQRMAEAVLQEAAQPQQGRGTAEGHVHSREGGTHQQRVLRERQGLRRERGAGRSAGSLHLNGWGSRSEGGSRSRARSGSNGDKLGPKATQAQLVQLQAQQLLAQAHRMHKQQRRDARAAERALARAQERAEAREAARANALRLVGIGSTAGGDEGPQDPQAPLSLLPPVLLAPAEGRGRAPRSSGSALVSSDYEDEELCEQE